ncbi:YfhE family protein [Lentibacillus saliphilus]|nr:YfhE family protein [Lentibacillus saliphilus]
MPKQPHEKEKFLSKTQEVLYQKEFKRANKAYEDAFKEQKRSRI